jgi:2-dehydropantoate 2-reductase
MKIAVLGAGTVGGWIGGAWASAGLDVTLIGRGAVVEEVNAHGLTLSDGSGDRPTRAIHLPAGTIACTADVKALKAADLILVTVKSIDTSPAARAIERHARRDAVVISFQNGISNVARLRGTTGGRKVLWGIVPYNVVRLGNGRWHKGVAGELIVQDDEVTRSIAETVGKRAGAMRLVDNIDAYAWSKLLINLNNAVNALSGLPLREQLKDRDYRAVVAESMEEALSVLKLAGIEPAKMGMVSPQSMPKVLRLPNLLFAPFLKAQKIDPEARSSMADDFAAGRPSEIDYLNGEIVALARKRGRNPPINAAIVQLVKEAEAGVERKWTGKELLARVTRRA